MKLKNYVTIDSHSAAPITFLLVAICASLVLYQALKSVLLLPVDKSVGAVFVICSVLILIGVRVSRRDLPKALQIVLYTCVLICTIFSVFASPSAPIEAYHSASHIGRGVQFFLEWAWFLALISFIISISRPVFGIFPPLVMSGLKQAHVQATGIALSPTDWLIIFETSVFLIIFVVFTCMIFLAVSKIRVLPDGLVKSLNSNRDYILNFGSLVALSIHFSNYLYSGWAKTGLGDNPLLESADPWSWVLENPTHLLIANAFYLGAQPFSYYPDFVSVLFSITKHLVVPLNLVVISTQFLCLLAVLNLRASRVLTALYDLQHIFIYLLTGIFFWKWIILNIGFVWALKWIEIPREQRFTLLLLPIIIIFAPSLFFTARLAWFDTPSVNRAYFVAEIGGGAAKRRSSLQLFSS